METEETGDNHFSNCEESHTACSAVNNLILDYYKKFGKKRDLEQFFSLSTAQSEVRDPCSLFWRRMKSQDESSDSGGKRSESSTELCRISIKCSIPEPSTSQAELSRVKSESESPPIISEEVIPEEPTEHSDNESVKSDDVQSQKSIDGTLDTSANKPHSPTSSITSQRKLEWDSLADVGYANESDRKNSASSLSTLERMALQQQYSYNDTKNSDIGNPTAQSTPLDVNESKSKHKKGAVKKTTKIYKKDIESLELSIPQNTDNNLQPINLNLTKHISFNVDRNGSVVIENMTKNVSLSPEKVSVETEVTPQIKMDKEIQTTLNRSKDKSFSSGEKVKDATPQVKRYPVLISLNTLKKKTKKKKVRRIKRHHSKKRLRNDKENMPLEKSGDQLSEAESFEYMPGHIYNQNQMKYDQRKNYVADNKSSLESSGLTTDSSKTTKYSFTKDLEKSIDILKSALDQKYEDANLRQNLIKEIVQKLVESKYKGDKSSTAFLSELSFNSKRLGLGDNNYTTTSTSDTNNTANEAKPSKPKKSILRMDKFNANPIASTSQSVPNIPSYTKNEKLLESKISKSIDLSNTDSDVPNKNKALSDIGVDKASSEELYKKYLEALKREQAYKRHLKDKEMFLKQKLVSSDAVRNAIKQVDAKAQNRIKDLMKDLIRNNYDDGSGDASKLEGGSSAYINIEKHNSLRKHKSHSVFTLSSGTSENRCKNVPVVNKHHTEAGSSNIDSKFEKHYCCCPLHAVHPKVGVTDSSVQVNIPTCRDHDSPHHKTKGMFQQPEIKPARCEKCKSPRNRPQTVSDGAKEHLKYVCLCTDDDVMSQEMPENFLIYKCSRLPSKNLKLEDIVSQVGNTASTGSSSNFTSPRQKISSFKSQDCERKCLVIKDSTSSNNQTSKSSQTNINIPLILRGTNSQQSISSTSTECRENGIDILEPQHNKPNFMIHEATRCIQTEISIDPKISDPSLSDINVVNDENCVELINETYKKVSQPALDKNDNHKLEKTCVQVQSSESSLPESKKKLQMGSDKCISTSAEEEFTFVRKFDKEVQSADHMTNNDTNRVDNNQCLNNFTIPIQGTNMTLKVSLGSGANRPPFDENILPKEIKTNKNVISKGTETVKPPVVETATSLQEECSKGVQSCDTNIFEEFYRKPPKTTCGENRNTYRDNFDSQVNYNEKANAPFKSSCVTASATADCKYNTYPTEDRSHIQKPLLRSNTDPSKIEKASHVTFYQKTVKDTENQPEVAEIPQRQSKAISPKQIEKAASCCSETSSKSVETSSKSKVSSDTDKQFKSSSSDTDGKTKELDCKDPVLDIIQDITKRYSKKDFEKSKRKKCFKEIISVLSYLLDTEESTDHDQNKASCSSAFDVYDTGENLPDKESADSIPGKTLVDKAVQLSTKKSKLHKTCTESSDLPTSTDFPSTSSDAATCKVLNKIKKECEKYHQKRCKLHTSGKKCEGSSSTSVNCDQCSRIHHCSCRGHKCKSHRTKTVEKTKKKCVAYNLIIQTSDSLVSEETNCGNNRRQLQNIIVKVPSKRKVENVPFKEMATKIERDMPHCSPRCNSRDNRSKSLPNDSEISSTDEIIRKAQDYTVREFLEKNRPDFIAKCSDRQDCLKLISESRAIERKAKRQLLSLQLDRKQALNALSESDLKDFARALGDELRRQKVAPKFISEREMKKHSEKIYKSLPEVVQKKEEIKKENIKKTNLLMANIFRKNLQKKTLRGSINISNYSSVIKI
ncbi:serine-rich adhesin for platelets-like [Maniola hyperantus]|uniref:serine-rich adhesin for platelets-like n=1 Tax=Aphantopus hyperantus TaxID=2795564 RepID=UPI0015683B81|nr:uncharacterized protein LOC117985027 [Maniola hyperantus]